MYANSGAILDADLNINMNFIYLACYTQVPEGWECLLVFYPHLLSFIPSYIFPNLYHVSKQRPEFKHRPYSFHKLTQATGAAAYKITSTIGNWNIYTKLLQRPCRTDHALETK
jgi:hypothetical protein